MCRKMFHVCGTYSKFFVEDKAQNAGSSPARLMQKRMYGENSGRKGAAAMEQIIESERYACVRTGMWKKRCKVVIGKQDVGE